MRYFFSFFIYSWFALMLFFSNGSKAMNKSAQLIAFSGISGSGKSTLASLLSAKLKAQAFLEPEEKDWPQIFKESKIYGEYSAMTALRNVRAKNLMDAELERQKGQTVIVDSLYDKISFYYLGQEGMEWLIAPEDPYFHAALAMCEADKNELPDPDVVILLDVDENKWIRFLESRKRERDSITGFRENFGCYQKYINQATKALCLERNIPLIEFKQQDDEAEISAQRLLEILKQNNVIKDD